MTTTTNINSITDLTDQLTLALILAITAPTEEKGVMCDKMAENLAQSLTFEQIEACKAAALEEIESGTRFRNCRTLEQLSHSSLTKQQSEPLEGLRHGEKSWTNPRPARASFEGKSRL